MGQISLWDKKNPTHIYNQGDVLLNSGNKGSGGSQRVTMKHGVGSKDREIWGLSPETENRPRMPLARREADGELKPCWGRWSLCFKTVRILPIYGSTEWGNFAQFIRLKFLFHLTLWNPSLYSVPSSCHSEASQGMPVCPTELCLPPQPTLCICITFSVCSAMDHSQPISRLAPFRSLPLSNVWLHGNHWQRSFLKYLQ